MRVLIFFFLLSTTVQAQPPVRLVTEKQEEMFRNQIPAVEDFEIYKILESKDLIFYTDKEMPRAFQHDGTFHNAFHNFSGEPDPFGNGNRAW